MPTGTAKTPPPPSTAVVTATWAGDERFAVSSAAGGSIVIDANKQAGTGPVDTLLGALASCSAVDVLAILAKRRTPAERLAIVVRGERRAEQPRCLTRAELEFRVDGAGIDAAHAERAIALAVDKYCSVATSLAPRIVLTSVLVLNGERHPARPRHAALPDGA